MLNRILRNEKCVTDITERKAKDGRLYVSAIFDCFDLTVLGLAMDDNTRAELCVRTLDSAAASKDKRNEKISPPSALLVMCITGCLMELWVTLFAGRGKAAL